LVATAPQGILFGRETGKPYALANIAFSYDVPVNHDRQLKLTLNINNLLNVRTQLNPIPAVDTGLRGTAVSGGLNFRF
jgi:outer membrane receptor protein involved in Fe transport